VWRERERREKREERREKREERRDMRRKVRDESQVIARSFKCAMTHKYLVHKCHDSFI